MTETDSDNDSLQRFIFENYPVRGEIVRLNASYLAVLDKHTYPEILRHLLGEILAASVLLGSGIKFKGSLTVQVQGQGPVELLLAQCDHERHIRGLAKWRGDVSNLKFKEMFEDGRLMITIDPAKGGHRYNAHVDLLGEVLSESITGYFQQSEQLLTLLLLSADDQQAAGILLQVIPGEADDQLAPFWEELTMLTQTLSNEELLSLPNRELIRRLYHQEDIRLFEHEPVSFRCHCSIERIERTIRALGYQEVKEQLKKDKHLEVICEFCNHHYHLDRVDVERIFASDQSAPPSSSTQH